MTAKLRPNDFDRIVEVVTAWPGVETGPHCFGGLQFRLGKSELGHLHGDGTLDLPFPITMRDRLIEEGWAAAHHVLPASGWVTYRIENRHDVDHALRLLRIAYVRRRMKISANVDEATDEALQLDISPAMRDALLGRDRQPLRVVRT